MNRRLLMTGLLATVLLSSGCSDDSDDSPCGARPIAFVEADGAYHCGNFGGPVVNEIDIDIDVKSKARKSPGTGVPFKPSPQYKPTYNKPAQPRTTTKIGK